MSKSGLRKRRRRTESFSGGVSDSESLDMTRRTPGQSKEEYERLLAVRGAGESKWSKFLTRLWTGWAMIFLFLAILKVGHVAVLCFIIALQARTFYELANVRYQAEKARAVPLFRTLQWCWFTGLDPFFQSFLGSSRLWDVLMVFSLFSLSLCLYVVWWMGL